MNLLDKRYTVFAEVIWRQKSGLFKLMGLALLAALATALMPWPLKILADYALADIPAGPLALTSADSIWRNPTFMITMAALASIMLFAFASILSVSSSWLWSKIGQQMVFDLSMIMFQRLQRLSKLFHSKNPVADSMGRLTVDSWCVFTIAQALLITPAQNIITLAVVGVVAWQIDPYLTIVSIAIAPVIAATTVVFGERLRRKAQINREAQTRVMTFVHQMLTAIPLVQAFGKESANCDRFRSLSDQAVKATQKNTLLDSGFTIVNALTMSIGLAIVLVLGGLRVVEGTITVGSLLVFLGYLSALQGETESLLLTFKNLKASQASSYRVLEILEADEEVSNASDSRVLPTSTRNRALGITFENVSFAYNAETPVLKNISLRIPAGKTVAFVGGSGSGKSTIASLIPRFFDCDDGRILLGDKDMIDIDLSSLRERISVVLQDPYLLPLSVADNIGYASPNASREDILAAATAASADAFIKKLPNGYDTVLGERGAGLSGGQKQRLAIARALLKDAPILLLDEPTSALDAHTESTLFQALNKLMEGRTTIMIAHRLSTVRNADIIVVLEKGEIAEQGNHEDLMALNGIYAEMLRLMPTDSTLEDAA